MPVGPKIARAAIFITTVATQFGSAPKYTFKHGVACGFTLQMVRGSCAESGIWGCVFVCSNNNIFLARHRDASIQFNGIKPSSCVHRWWGRFGVDNFTAVHGTVYLTGRRRRFLAMNLDWGEDLHET